MMCCLLPSKTIAPLWLNGKKSVMAAVKQKKTAGKESDGVTLLEFLDGLSADEQRAALIHLSVKWAEQKGCIC